MVVNAGGCSGEDERDSFHGFVRVFLFVVLFWTEVAALGRGCIKFVLFRFYLHNFNALQAWCNFILSELLSLNNFIIDKTTIR